MNKTLLWLGLFFQFLHLLAFLGWGAMTMDWSFIDSQLILIIGYITFNLITLIMIVIGALGGK